MAIDSLCVISYSTAWHLNASIISAEAVQDRYSRLVEACLSNSAFFDDLERWSRSFHTLLNVEKQFVVQQQCKTRRYVAILAHDSKAFLVTTVDFIDSLK